MRTPHEALRIETSLPAYQGLPDAQVVALINAPGPDQPAPIPAVWVPQFFGANGLREAVEDLGHTAGHPLRSACLALVDFFWGVGAGRVFDVTDPGLVAMLDGFVSAGVMTADQEAALIHLNAQPTPSKAATLGFPAGVTTADLQAARS